MDSAAAVAGNMISDSNPTADMMVNQKIGLAVLCIGLPSLLIVRISMS